MQHIRRKIMELRRYIAASKSRGDLDEVDALLAVALVELRKKINEVEARNDHSKDDTG